MKILCLGSANFFFSSGRGARTVFQRRNRKLNAFQTADYYFFAI